MNILLWILQVAIALFAISGSFWRITNYETAAKQVASVGALSSMAWNLIGIYEIAASVLLIGAGLMKMKPSVTVYTAVALGVEMLCVTALHAKYFGLEPKATNPAMWSLGLAIVAFFVAYGRSALSPLGA
jgi:hypothetical protein